MISYANREKELNNINIDLMTKYLINNGWKLKKDFPNKKIIHFEKKYDGEEFYVNIPSSEKFKDFKVRIIDAISNLAALEEVEFNDILMLISNKDNLSDTLSVRIISNISKDGKIPLEYSRYVIEGISKLFISAIANENNPKPYFTKGCKYDYSELSNYYLSQTDVGSYIFNIEINNKINEQEILGETVDESDTPQRRVLKRIQNGLSIISNKDNDMNINSMYKEGFNVNMCDAILNLMNDEYKIDLETSVKWAEGLEKPKGIPEKILIDNEKLKKIESISKKYKSEAKVKINNIKGYIIKLECKKDKNKKISSRNIVIQTMINKRERQVKVYLSEKEYKLAIEAHSNDSIVCAYGEVFTKGNSLEIHECIKFDIC